MSKQNLWECRNVSHNIIIIIIILAHPLGENGHHVVGQINSFQFVRLPPEDKRKTLPAGKTLWSSWYWSATTNVMIKVLMMILILDLWEHYFHCIVIIDHWLLITDQWSLITDHSDIGAHRDNHTCPLGTSSWWWTGCCCGKGQCFWC